MNKIGLKATPLRVRTLCGFLLSGKDKAMHDFEINIWIVLAQNPNIYFKIVYGATSDVANR